MPGGAMSRYDDADGEGGRKPRMLRRAAGDRRYSNRMLVAGSVSIVVTLALVVASLAAYVRYRAVWDSINRIDVSKDLTNRPPKYGNALNVLLIGSDSRKGRNGKIGGYTPGQRSDTVMVLHISPGRHTAVVLSFPRDSVVPILQCAPIDGTPGQQAQPGQVEQLNSTFAFGGPGCLQKTLEDTTHIRLDDFIQLTFVGFEKVINDIGGVNVCLPQSVNVPQSGLHLSRGRHHIYGGQALAFWRSRESLGKGSDLQRIQRDQFLMASLLQGVEKSGILKSPRQMITVVTDAAKAMRTDTGLTPGKMLQIAESLRGLSTKSVQFIQVPTAAYSLNQNWVQWISPQDPQLFSAIAHDSKLPKLPKSKHKKVPAKLAGSGGKSGKTGTATAAGKSAVLGTISPAKVNVEVLNGSQVQGIAAQTATDLTGRGFNVVGNGNAANFAYTTSVIEYASAADLPAARTLKGQLGHVTLQLDSGLTPGTVVLILGSSFTTLKPVSAASAHARVAGLTKQFGGITGNVNVCHDSAAFAS
jgi:LCP family protein required for cell wall assembly